MDKDPETSERPKPPPPDLPKGPPPPPEPTIAEAAPPAAPRPGPAAQEPPLKVSVAPEGREETAPEPVADDAPGTDASMNNRIIATVLDYLVALGLSIGASIILPSFLDRVGTLLFIAYILLRDCLPFLDGQSIGKKAVGIRAVTSDGRSLAGNWQPGILRNIALPIPLFAFVELFVLISRQDKAGFTLRLGDEWGKTKVVNAPRSDEEAGVEASGDDAG